MESIFPSPLSPFHQAWMFATPIAYPSSLLDEPWRTLYGINPMAGVVEGFRWALLGTARRYYPRFGLGCSRATDQWGFLLSADGEDVCGCGVTMEGGKVAVQIETNKLCKELKETLHQIYGENLRGLYLYGSFANREADAESDLDVAIVLKDFRDYWQEIRRTSPIISELSLKYNVSISPVRIREAEWVQEDSPFLNNVRKECIAL